MMSRSLRPCKSQISRTRSAAPSTPHRRYNVLVAPRPSCQRVCAANGDPLTVIAQQLLEKEEQLRAMFEPGKKMPRAAVVAKLRKEIADLRDSLSGAAQSGSLPREIPLAASPATAPSAASPSAAATSTPVASSLVENATAEVDMNRAHQILLEVEAKLRVQQQDDFELAAGNPQHSASRISVEVARLEAENTRLRKRAHALLTRQLALEEAYKNYFGQEWVPREASQVQEEATVFSFPSNSYSEDNSPDGRRVTRARKRAEEFQSSDCAPQEPLVYNDEQPSWLVAEPVASTVRA